MYRRISRLIKYNWPDDGLFILILFFIIVLLLVPIDYVYGIQTHDFLVHINGILVSFFIYALFLNIYNKIRQNSTLKKIYHEEISDFRDWKSEESKFKAIANIKKLFKLGEKSFDLNRYYLQEAYLENMEFINTNFNCTDFTRSNIRNCVFESCDFKGAQFSSANLFNCTFRNCQINSANFVESILYEIDFNESDLKNFGSFPIKGAASITRRAP